MVANILLVAPFLAASVLAANNWSKPCFGGVCEYDLPAASGSSSGTLKIWGATSAISDITPAAGWEIIGCSPDALQQNIRLVCKNEGSAACAHLHGNKKNGAVGKLVRLPENCGKSAFAVVTKSYVPADQSIPASIAASLTRRDGVLPQVQGLRLSTSFASVDTSSIGPINFAIRAANVPGANGALATSSIQSHGNSRIFQRNIFTDFIKKAISDLAALNTFNVTNSKTLAPFDVDKTFNLVDASVTCPAVSAGVKIDLETKAHAVASIGVAAGGTIIPPTVSDFAVIVTLNAELDGTIIMNATAAGSLDSGKVQLFQVGIPGLDFPGVLTIGPSFEIDAQASASLEVDVDLAVGINYNITNAQLVFPPNGKKGGAFSITDTPLKLSAIPTANATGSVVAHLIPSVNLGITALGGAVDASIFLELDASASMSLGVQAEANANATITPREPRTAHRFQRIASSAKATSTAVAKSVASSTVTSSAVSTTSAAVVTAEKASTNATATGAASASFSGCFEIDAAFDVNAGATGSFFGIFDQTTQVSLFSKKFELFKKCFGGSASTRRSLLDASRRSLPPLSVARRTPVTVVQKRAIDLSCPSPSTSVSSGLQSIFDQILSGSSILSL